MLKERVFFSGRTAGRVVVCKDNALFFQFNLSENNEENIFKLMFKVSRNENNDLMFLEEHVTGMIHIYTVEDFMQ